MHAIETCRTEALGGVVEWCDHCQYMRIPGDAERHSGVKPNGVPG
jgi:hypothetical protein